MTTDTIISKVWSFCTTLRDDGVGFGDYLEQLTYLIFLKMADEYGRPPYKRDVGVPKRYAWATLKPLKGAELEVHYVETLRALGTEKGMLGQIFTKAQSKITDPANLARLIEMVDATEWVMLDSDVKGDIYEDILEKNAEDTKSGAGTMASNYRSFCSSLPEQREIIRLLDEQFTVIEQNEREIDAALKRSAVLRQSILKRPAPARSSSKIPPPPCWSGFGTSGKSAR